ncbi:MAG TPA: ferritin-like domain-containing protein [Steroidobacteraceae bacterium]|nr:ferritin-like domain-containing protein [Steroidobacteraceae bacterium]
MSDMGNGITRRAVLGSFAMLGIASGPGRALAAEHKKSTVHRHFSNSYLELIRLLKEAAEIEHDLMVQYLYGGFSLKPAYAEIVGAPAPSTTSFMGVTIQEMQHLGAVNRLLVELDASPVLTRQDFPYESDIYPFAFELTPLSPASLAKFTYCEAAPDALTKTSNGAPRLLDQLKTTLGGSIAPNHVGHLYDAVIDTLDEVKKAGAARLEFDKWDEDLHHIKDEGEIGHFTFFQSLYSGAHPLLKKTPVTWTVPAGDANSPCYKVPHNPTAYAGHEHSIENEDLRKLAWLGNLNYWVMLSLLDAGYRRKSQLEIALSQTVMMGPIWSIAKYLPTKGAAIPFDPLSMGFKPGLSSAADKQFTHLMLEEARSYAQSIDKLLPGDFNIKLYDQLLATVG